MIKRKTDDDFGTIDKKTSYENVKSYFVKYNDRIFKKCLDCNLGPEELNWYKFRTSDSSWEHLCGREGYYSNCPNCKKEIENIITIMN